MIADCIKGVSDILSIGKAETVSGWQRQRYKFMSHTPNEVLKQQQHNIYFDAN